MHRGDRWIMGCTVDKIWRGDIYQSHIDNWLELSVNIIQEYSDICIYCIIAYTLGIYHSGHTTHCGLYQVTFTNQAECLW
jgi:hypothetical protein